MTAYFRALLDFRKESICKSLEVVMKFYLWVPLENLFFHSHPNKFSKIWWLSEGKEKGAEMSERISRSVITKMLWETQQSHSTEFCQENFQLFSYPRYSCFTSAVINWSKETKLGANFSSTITHIDFYTACYHYQAITPAAMFNMTWHLYVHYFSP